MSFLFTEEEEGGFVNIHKDQGEEEGQRWCLAWNMTSVIPSLKPSACYEYKEEEGKMG